MCLTIECCHAAIVQRRHVWQGSSEWNCKESGDTCVVTAVAGLGAWRQEEPQRLQRLVHVLAVQVDLLEPALGVPVLQQCIALLGQPCFACMHTCMKGTFR